MKMRIFILFALLACAYAAEEADKQNTEAVETKDKRQTQEGNHGQLIYRSARKQEGAPVMESQEDDKGTLRNRTSPTPISEDQSAKVDRQTREKPENEDSSDSSKDQNKIDLPTPVENNEAKDIAQLNAPQVDIQHHGLSVDDRQRPIIPPPRDGKSYTPEEFTSLIVSGYAVTPIPDYGADLAQQKSLYGSVAPTAAPPIQYPSAQFSSSPFSSNPYFSRDYPVTSTLAPSLLGLRENPKLDQNNLQAGLEQLRSRLEGQRSLPPPKNNKAYTYEEYNNLVAAGYPVTPVPVAPLSLDISQSSRGDAEQYRPGQVFSLHPRELLDLQPERKAPLSSNQQQLLQQLYGNPQQEHKQNLQPIYFLDPQSQGGRQVSSHAVIARPNFSFNGGEASVGAALSVSDNGGHSADFNQELLALLGQAGVRPQEVRPTQSTATQTLAPQYQQVERYISKPSKKSSKLRSKTKTTPQPSPAPQQYLIETTNVQQQQPQYRPTPQPQRLAQSLRYVPIPQPSQPLDQFAYERPESQGLKIVPAPQLQQSRAQFNYRLAPQYQQQEAAPKQYRLVELPRAQPIRQELRIPASNVERPVAYLKRYPELEKQRSVKVYDPVESISQQQAQQLFGEQFVLRPAYRTNEQRSRYEQPKSESRVAESTKAPHSSIYVSKNLPAPRHQKTRTQAREQSVKFEQADFDQVNIEQHGQSLDEQRSHLPPPRNSKAYTPEEFAALVAAGYSVTPVPVSALNLDVAQSRSSVESMTPQPKRRQPTQRRRNQYLPVRDDAP